MSKKRVTDRALLRFTDEVKARFAFLEARGFNCVSTDVTLVRFESPELGVNIFHGRQSYEIGLELESLVSKTEKYSFSELLRLVDQERAECYRSFAATNAEGVAEGVRQLADSVQQCIAAGLLGDTELFSRLKRQRHDLTKKLSLDVQLQHARQKTEAAWHTKDYATIVRIMKPLRAYLSASEVAKLEFAEKHI